MSPLAGSRIAAFACLAAAAALPGVNGTVVDGKVQLGPREARVVTKFCWDFNPACPFSANSSSPCPMEIRPALFEADVWGGVIDSSSAASTGAAPKDGEKKEPKIWIALLDDEYYSFPLLKEVFDDVHCQEIVNRAKSKVEIEWKSIEGNNHQNYLRRIAQHVRPRWWYVTVVSCADVGVELSYHMHMNNTLRGWQSELSADHQGVPILAFLQAAVLCALASRQWKSAQEWSLQGVTRRCFRLHPAVMVITAASFLAAASSVGYFVYFYHMLQGVAAYRGLSAFCRAGMIAAKTLISILLMMLARGQCVCTAELSWFEHKEVVFGLSVFGVLSFWLESWGSSEVTNTSVEYIYDTRPGTALVMLDMLWLYLYASRCWATWDAETRVRPKFFYRRYGAPWTAWFASLPVIACVASLLDPWVRFKVTYAVNSLVLAATLGTLVHSFRPEVAVKLYELTEYEPVDVDELNRFMEEDDEL